MSYGNEKVEVMVDYVLAITDGALKCTVRGEDFWIPKSVIEGGGAGLRQHQRDVEIFVSKWFVEKEGMDY